MSTEKKSNSGSATSNSNASNDASNRQRSPKKSRSRKRGSGISKKKKHSSDNETIKRAKLRFEASPTPLGLEVEINPPPRNVSIDWKLNPVPSKIEREMHDIVVRPGEFGFLDDERVDEIAKLIGKRPISLEQALSLRAALNQEKAVFSHGRLQRRATEMRRRYDSGESVVSLSKRFDFPPVNIFRAILTAKNWSKNRIKDALREPEKKFNERDLKEFKRAEAEDRVTHVNQSETHHAADLFEKMLCDYFEENDIRFRTQSDLLKEQVAAEGRPVKTPDLLMLDYVEINGVPVAWIDAKHFYGANLSFQRKKTQKQVNRYVEEWGHGAIIFRHGFCDGLRLKGAVLLDASPIDLTELIEHNQRLNSERESED
ncbi:MAG: TPD domain-containing protein [Candidatus Thalassarchaeaceae archaeon]|nr:TPD domain-containing protein [Candidatus Thalassarchaeaceae archaeon]